MHIYSFIHSFVWRGNEDDIAVVNGLWFWFCLGKYRHLGDKIGIGNGNSRSE